MCCPGSAGLFDSQLLLDVLNDLCARSPKAARIEEMSGCAMLAK